MVVLLCFATWVFRSDKLYVHTNTHSTASIQWICVMTTYCRHRRCVFLFAKGPLTVKSLSFPEQTSPSTKALAQLFITAFTQPFVENQKDREISSLLTGSTTTTNFPRNISSSHSGPSNASSDSRYEDIQISANGLRTVA